MKQDFVHLFGSLLRLYCDALSAKQHNITLVYHFPFSLQLWMYHAPLTWYEQESLGHKANFEALLKALSVPPTGRFTRSQNP